MLPVWAVKTIGKKGIPGRTPAQTPIRGSRGLRQGRPDIGISKLGALGNHRHLGSQGAEALAELSREGQKGICKGDPQQIEMDPRAMREDRLGSCRELTHSMRKGQNCTNT